MAARPRSRTPPKLATFARRVLVVLAAAALVAGVLACGTDRTAVGTADERAAQQVQEYFEGRGARYVEGLAVENIQVTNEARGRTLSLRLVSNGSDRADGSLSSLYYMSISDDGWTAELNQVGLSLAWVLMEFDYPDGSREVLEVDVSGQGVAGSTRLRPGPPTT